MTWRKQIDYNMRKVLVIDDVFENIEVIKSILSKALPDVNVLEAFSGKIGIMIARDEDPDCILLDIMMPEMDGYEVCEQLKSDMLTKHIPVILISAFVKDSESVTKGLNLGADGFLRKPIKPSEMVAQMGVALRIRNAENMLRSESHKYKIMTETVPEAVITAGLKNNITYSSDQASRLFCYEKSADLVQINILELFHPENKEEAEICIENIKKNHFLKDVDFRFVKNDTSDFAGELSGSPIMDIQNEPKELIFVIRDITERKQSEKSILAYQQKLKSLNLRLISAEEKERKLIAEALHDGLGQILAIAKIKLTSILQESNMQMAYDVIQESVELIEEAIKETRSLTYNLSPPILHELGLQAAIEWKLGKISNEYGISTSFIDNLVDNPLDNDVNILLYRIVSELLTNVVKHAKAHTVSIQLSEDQNNIYLRVADDGAGFNVNIDTPLTYSGFGLFDIYERLESIQGSMKIDSHIGDGAEIIIRIPLLNSKSCP